MLQSISLAAVPIQASGETFAIQISTARFLFRGHGESKGNRLHLLRKFLGGGELRRDLLITEACGRLTSTITCQHGAYGYLIKLRRNRGNAQNDVPSIYVQHNYFLYTMKPCSTCSQFSRDILMREHPVVE